MTANPDTRPYCPNSYCRGVCSPVETYGGTVIGYQCGTCHSVFSFGPCPRCGGSVTFPDDHCRVHCAAVGCFTLVDAADPPGRCPRHEVKQVTCRGCAGEFAVTADKVANGRAYCTEKCRAKHRRRRKTLDELRRDRTT